MTIGLRESRDVALSDCVTSSCGQTDTSRKLNIGYLVSHPIQYQAPLLRRINQNTQWKLDVFFQSDVSVRGGYDSGFERRVKWTTDLVSGYNHVFLRRAFGSNDLTFWSPFNHGLARELRRRRIDILWVHGYGRLYNLYAILLARVLGVKVFMRDEAHLRSRTRSVLAKIKSKVVFLYLRVFVDRFLAIGSANADYYRQQGIVEGRIVLMPYTVDNDHFSIKTIIEKRAAGQVLRERLGLGNKAKIILFASKLIKRKRCEDIILAFSKYVRVSDVPTVLVIVGDGYLRGELEGLTEQLGLDGQVRFLGFQNQDSLPSLYAGADVFVLPSEDEPWGLAVNEAMAAGCAILVSKYVGSAFDLVFEGRNGYLHAPGDTEALMNGLMRLLRDDSALSQAWSESLRIIDKWSFTESVEGLALALSSLPKPARSSLGGIVIRGGPFGWARGWFGILVRRALRGSWGRRHG